ncbi:hypothetical protein JAAARDRAFT_422698 [Jaapia argillacea MUCL 33604]|uniref:Uncharacterized protein n=1 Tax=Jaapia argillacea MUCL 33604 TaxID=933084 RepID=A0A067PIU5_9AGAM|nr:hypothetical protein JAAARDRAFT_422698 [Jaapia argillacea MUCL 33604]
MSPNAPTPTRPPSRPLPVMATPTTRDILQLPSARGAALSRNTSIDAFLRWLRTPGARADGVLESPLGYMMWMRSHSHEYLILQFGCTWLRVQRKTSKLRRPSHSRGSSRRLAFSSTLRDRLGMLRSTTQSHHPRRQLRQYLYLQFLVARRLYLE